MPGLTKQKGDCVDALGRLEKVVHGSKTIVEGNEETYRFMVNLKKSMPTKYDWLLPVPGFWHILLHSAKALFQRYYLAGIQAICISCGADDKHVLGGKNYRRSHHWLVATYEGFWYCVSKQYMDLHKTDAPGGAVRLTADEVCNNVQP